MPRRKISTNENSTAAVAELDDNEELVFETTKRVRRERKPPPDESEPGAVATGELDPDDDAITLEAMEDEDGEVYGVGTLASLIYGEDAERIENQFCTVSIRRNPDGMNDGFLTPCHSLKKLAPIRMVALSEPVMDIEDRVRREYGGGHYFFQVHFNSRLGASWTSTLADDPAALARERAAETAASAVPPAPPPVNPVDAFLDSIEKQNRMKELLFGDREREFERMMSELRDENRRLRDRPDEPKPERLLLLEQAISLSDGNMQSRVLNHLFPSEDGKARHWAADMLDLAMANADKLPVLAHAAGSLLGGLFGTGAAAPPPAAAPPALPARDPTLDFLKAQPPGGFRPKRPKTEPEAAATGAVESDEQRAANDEPPK